MKVRCAEMIIIDGDVAVYVVRVKKCLSEAS